MSEPMASAYDPRAVESAWYHWWVKQGYFSPELTEDGKVKPEGLFVVPAPPPNVTGSLHIGHALTVAIQDTLVRWQVTESFLKIFAIYSDVKLRIGTVCLARLFFSILVPITLVFLASPSSRRNCGSSKRRLAMTSDVKHSLLRFGSGRRNTATESTSNFTV